MLRNILIISLFTIGAGCSASNEGGNTRATPRFLEQSAIAGTWNFVATADSFGSTSVAATDGTARNVNTVLAVGASIAGTPAVNNTIIAASRGFIVGNPTATGANVDYWTRTESGPGNSSALTDGSAVYEINFIRSGTIITRTLASPQVVQPLPRWVKIRLDGNTIYTSAIFPGAAGAAAVSIDQVNRVLATRVQP